MVKYNQFLNIGEEVAGALAGGLPVVALESTIISHGFKHPENIDCATRCERIIRDCGAVPATIAIIGGKIKVGLTEGEIGHLATSGNIPKCSRRDVAPLLAAGKDGATTVATTMMFAEMAGISVFATGGIGGVHRQGHETFDISADLQELARTNVAVVCAGAKSILDIPLTREYLETFGVTVLGYRTDYFPCFYVRESDVLVDYNLQTPLEIAKVIHTKNALGIGGGVLIANPIPENDEMDPVYIGGIIDRAVREAQEQDVKGKAITPFILKRLHDVTEGKTAAANKALVWNNARLAAEVACELASVRSPAV